MPFDQKTRNLLQRTVTACRLILSEEFGKQLRETYGISDDGTVASWEALSHLSDEDTQTSRLLRDRLDHLATGLTSQGKSLASARQESVKRIIREQAFTVLNRLAALRMAEERQIVLECVSRGHQSDGFCLFQQNTHGALGEIEESYRAYLFVLFDFLSIDLGVLFNRWDLAGLLFPRKDALDNVLKELQGKSATKADEISPAQFSAIWAEDETIGWIYQYYNCPIERKKMREESAAPRNTRELAVRNQFFTPRYVVEFLTDNTLGRIWYEMTQGDTKLKEQCRYLVRRPTEIFLQPGETAPERGSPDPQQAANGIAATNLPNAATASSPSTLHSQPSAAPTQEELLKEPVHIPHRPLKDPRTILMLDPACGSMHFGLYAFDLFEVIYDEAWEMAERIKGEGRSIQELEAAYPQFSSFILHTSSFQSKESFLRQVPRLIIEHNLHGIDIDPRCAQIAGLSLWLRAQKAWQRLGIKPAERPAIKRSNIVCAEPMPGEKELLREFVEREFPAAERPVCLRLLEAIFDKMQLAGEAGSLLKIEEEIRSAIEDARDAWQKLATKPPELFTTTELNQLSTAPELTGLEQAVSSLTTDPRHLTTDFWERIEERIYAALRDYAEQAENGGGFQRRLFAEDAARGFAFIDVCRKRYDVALMNPPFGEPAKLSREYLANCYPEYKYDVFAMFVVRYLSLLNEDGRLGAITNKTGFFLQTFDSWRQFITSHPHYLASAVDLGFGVLDNAMVETMAYVIQRQAKQVSPLSLFCRLTNAEQKALGLSECLEKVRAGESCSFAWLRNTEDFKLIPYRPMCYWADDNFLRLFAANKPFAPQFGHIYQGIATGDNLRFLRCRWEVALESIASGKWVTYAKGGESTPYYAEFPLVVLWLKDGQEIKENARQCYGSASRTVKNEDAFFKAGITYTQVTVKGFFPRVLPQGCVFDMKGPSVLMSDTDLYASLGILCSAPIKVLAKLLTDCRQWHPTNLMNLPFPDLPAEGRTKISQATKQLTRIYQTPFRRDESSALFCELRNNANETSGQDQAVLSIDELVSSSFGVALDEFQTLEEFLQPTGIEQEEEDDAPAFAVDSTTASVHYALGCAFGRWDIRYATGEQAAPELPDPFAPLPVCPPGQLQNAQGLPARPEDVPAAYPVRIPWDGILVDDPNHPLDIERRVREVIEIIWSGQEGGPTAEAIEHEACEILGVKSLRDYFRKPAGFFADHLKRYSKSRRQAPIYWPLGTPSGSYTLWIYYHRLTSDTLYKCLQQFVEPKIKEVEQDIHHLRTVINSNEGGTKERDQIQNKEALHSELLTLHAELTHWAPRWKPNLNDGVLLTAAPLWKLFRLPKWRTALETSWKELQDGDYDWAHLAHTLWPDRVREKCQSDRSLAIAHGLESLCEVKAPEKKAKKAPKKAAVPPKEPDML